MDLPETGEEERRDRTKIEFTTECEISFSSLLETFKEHPVPCLIFVNRECRSFITSALPLLTMMVIDDLKPGRKQTFQH